MYIEDGVMMFEFKLIMVNDGVDRELLMFKMNN